MSSLKIGLCSDLHITNSNPKYPKDEDGISELVKRQVKFGKHFVEKCEEEGSDAIVFAGDITDSEHLNPVEQSALSKFCKQFEKFDGDSFVLSGNHTVFDKVNRQYSVVGALSNYLEGSRCITTPYTEAIGSVRLHFYPYQSLEAIRSDSVSGVLNNKLEDSDYFEVCIFHFPIKGAKLDNGYPSESGLDLSEYPIHNVFDLCIGGDFHRPQRVEDNVYYIGAPFDLKFGDYTDWRGFRIVEIFDDGTFEIEDFQNPHNVSFWSGEYDDFKTEFDDGEDDVFVKVKGEVSKDEIEELDEKADEFYNLSRPTVDYKEDDKNEYVDTLDEEDYDEEDLIRKKLKPELEDEELERAIEIFRKVQS